MRTWSPSAVRAYQECPAAWKILYSEGKRPGRTDDVTGVPVKMLLGTLAHVGFEVAYKRVAAGYSDAGTTMYGLIDDAAEAIEDTYSRWASPRLQQWDLDVVTAQVCQVLETVKRPQAEHVIGIEQRIDDEVEGIPWTNVIDLALRTGPHSLHIRDWKRRKFASLPRTTQLPEDPPMASYRHAVATRYPWATSVTVGLYSIVDNREVVADLPIARARYVMARQAEVARHAEADTDCYPAPDGTNCIDCRARPLCPLWAHERTHD